MVLYLTQPNTPKMTRKYALRFSYVFRPALWLPSSHQSTPSPTRIPEEFPLHAWQARHQWRLELPLGLFAGSYGPDVTWAQELAARTALFDKAQPHYFRARDIIEHEGVLYYRRHVLERVRDFHEDPTLIYALLAFWRAAEVDRSLIKGTPPPRPFVAPEQRLERFGVPCRGPSWTKDEDDVLRRWFGRRTIGPNAGRHVPLTDAEWTTVLDALGRRRTRSSVTQRLCILNERLRREFVANGWLRNGVAKIEHAEAWMQRVLGERPRRLRTRRRV